MYSVNKPYLIDAIVGNSRMLASAGKNGRIYRLWWPHIDYPQHVDCIRSGLLIDGRVTWFDNEPDGWQHHAAYKVRSNILTVKAVSEACPVEVSVDMFAIPGRDVMVRHFNFQNTSEQTVEASFIHYSSFHIHENPLYNTVMFDDRQDALTHFRKEYFFAVSGSNVCTQYQAGNQAWRSAQHGELNGSKIDMATDGALAWNLLIPPGCNSELTIYIAAGCSQDEAADHLNHAKCKGYVHWLDHTVNYWQDYLSRTAPCPIDSADLRQLYERSLLAMKLMSDEQSGAVIAAPEFDEQFSMCGGYSYCWGRDAAFIATAMDRSGLQNLSARFYEWALSAQSADGSWQQRHYHDGKLAPSWGLQIDEGASILWGMWQHYQVVQQRAFADQVWPAVRNGAIFLAEFIDPDTGLPLPSMDLWEERTAEHVYSAAAVFGGLQAAAAFAELRGEASWAQQWQETAEQIRKAIINRCWNAEKSSYLRALKIQVDKAAYTTAKQEGKTGFVERDNKGYSTFVLREDPILDISLLGLCIPFGLLPPDDPRMVQTADAIEAQLTVPGVGGIKRYEDDSYVGGNPWILTTLWLAQYRIRQGRLDAARALLQWAVDHQTELGLLPEQVDRETGRVAWVVPLTWSHAMFILTVHMLAEAEKQVSA